MWKWGFKTEKEKGSGWNPVYLPDSFHLSSSSLLCPGHPVHERTVLCFVPAYHSLRCFGEQNFLFTLLIYLASDQVWKQTPSLLDKYLHCVSISTGIHQHHELSAFNIKTAEMFITCLGSLFTFLLIVVVPQLSIGRFYSFSHSSCSLSTSFSI